MDNVMCAKGAVKIGGELVKLEWIVLNLKYNHSLLRFGTEDIMGRTFGLFQNRSVVFCAKGIDCGLVEGDDEFVDLIRIPAPVRGDGMATARYYPPPLALQLRRLAQRRQQGSRSEVRPQVDRWARLGLRVELDVVLPSVASLAAE